MKKIIATTTLAATALAGGIVLGPTLAGAQDDPAVESTGSSFIADALAPLVADGTLTQPQADAVEDALRTARESRTDRRGHHRGPRGFGDAEVLEQLGLDPETVRDGLRDGSNLGEIAEANGVSADAVVDAIIAQAEERLADAVEAGRLTEEEAEEKALDIEERAEAIVDGAFEGRRGRGFHGPGPGADES